MSEIQEIVWDNTTEKDLYNNILSYKNNAIIPNYFSKDEFLNLKKESILFLNNYFQTDFNSSLLIFTGHQAEFQHPGILFKDLVSLELAKIWNAKSIHIIVDTDQADISYKFPSCNNKQAEIKELKFNSELILNHYSLTSSNSKLLLDTIDKQIQELTCFSTNSKFAFTKEFLEYLKNLLLKENNLVIINKELRKKYFEKFNSTLYQIELSKLLKLNSFKTLFEKIKSNHKEFIHAYNQSLDEYRKEHKIKNPAQPIPNLNLDELPFWHLDSTNTRSSLQLEEEIHTENILPKAITLTMFIRLFLSDFFIHGKGGGRYEAVSDSIIKKFFGVEASPYKIASATLYMEVNSNWNLIEEDEKSIEQKLRDINYSPEKFLSADHELVMKKKSLQELFKDKNTDKKSLHNQIAEINQTLSSLLEEKRLELLKIKENLPIFLKTKQVFQTRDLPFYLYDMKSLENSVTQVFKT
jgi:hypothetical protein